MSEPAYFPRPQIIKAKQWLPPQVAAADRDGWADACLDMGRWLEEQGLHDELSPIFSFITTDMLVPAPHTGHDLHIKRGDWLVLGPGGSWQILDEAIFWKVYDEL